MLLPGDYDTDCTVLITMFVLVPKWFNFLFAILKLMTIRLSGIHQLGAVKAHDVMAYMIVRKIHGNKLGILKHTMACPTCTKDTGKLSLFLRSCGQQRKAYARKHACATKHANGAWFRVSAKTRGGWTRSN